MPSIYTAIQNSIGKALNAFRERNIEDLYPARLEECGVVAVRESSIGVKYDFFVRNIHAFAEATLIDRILVKPETMYAVLQRIPTVSPVAIPQAEFSIKDVTQEERATLEGLGLSEVTGTRDRFEGRLSYDNLNLAYTHQGKEMQHIFFGLSMAIETGARLRIFIENRVYLGFLLLGKDIRIIYRNKVLSPSKPADLRKICVDILSKHSTSLRALVEKLNLCAYKDGSTPTSLEYEDVMKLSSRGILELFVERDLSVWSGEVKEEVTALIDCLTFDESYMEMNEDNISILITKIHANRKFKKDFPDTFEEALHSPQIQLSIRCPPLVLARLPLMVERRRSPYLALDVQTRILKSTIRPTVGAFPIFLFTISLLCPRPPTGTRFVTMETSRSENRKLAGKGSRRATSR